MVAKLKTRTKVVKRSVPVSLPLSKRKKFQQKNKQTGRASDYITDSSEETFKEQDLSSSDEFQDGSFEEEIQGISDSSSSGEHGDSDSEAEHADYSFPVPNSTDQGELDSDDAMNEEQHNVQDLPYAVRDEELEALDREYKELQAQEVNMLQNLKGRSDEEVLKGQAVRSQKGLWDKALEVRILLQKPFLNANRLPLGDSKVQMCESSKEVESAFAKLNATSVNTLHCLHQTLKVLVNQADSMSKASDNNVALKEDEDLEALDDLDTIWQRLSASYARFVPFRNSSVDRWQRKTQLSSGAAASKSKLRAFDQSISQQIETHMRDFSRMLQRMCLRRASVNVIGMPAGQAEDPFLNENTNGFTDGKKDFSGDPELIDDTEFYQELLREFLESSDPSSLGTMYPIRNMRKKNRKIVDRRASKGRKIRYNVHDKIVNFMVPIPTNMPSMAEKLFSAGLFQGGSMQPLNL